MVENALLFGQTAGTLPLKVELGDAARGSRKDTMRVTLRVLVPLGEVTTVKRGEGFEAELELRVAVLDELGRRNDLPAAPVRFRTARAPAPGEYTRYEAELEIRRVRHHVIVALFDPASGKLFQARGVVAP